MANFELNKKTVMVRVTGPSSVIDRKEGYRRAVKTSETFLHFLEDMCKLKVRHMVDELHIMAVSHTGRKDRLTLTATVKEFIELNYKGPAKSGFYCVKVVKTLKLRPPSRFSRRYSSVSCSGRDVEVIDLDVDDGDQISHQAEGDEDVGRLVEDVKGDSEEEAEEETPKGILTTPSTKPSTASEEEASNRGSEKKISTPSSVSFSSIKNRPSTSTTTPASSRGENSGSRKSGMGMEPPQEPKALVKSEQKCKRRSEQWESFDPESMLDLEAEGINGRENLRPIVKKNVRTIGNCTLLRVREEMRFLREAKIGNTALWDKITDRAPFMAHFMARMFEESGESD